MERERSPRNTARPARGGMARAFLRVPLFYKILIANSLIVGVGAVIGTAITRHLLRTAPAEVDAAAVVVLMALGGVLVTVLVNALILRLALTPLNLLEETAARVRAGDLDARVPYSALLDRRLERLTLTFNAMLDTVETYRQRLRDVAARALHAEEEERKRIARELHDDTAQTLAALLIRMRVARVTEDAEARAALLEQFRVEVGEALERVRRFARGLRPPALDELGLVPALESHIRGLGESVGAAIRLEADPVEDLLPPQAELALYRIAQEALSNAIRHAEAAEIRVRVERDEGAVSLSVTDDGRGFRPEAVLAGADGTGLGLFGMQERAAYVGGRVEIRSRPGAGTRVVITVPTAEPGPGRARSLWPVVDRPGEAE
jgi:two-component system, NarL family, sensor histidine kinase UhpB